MNFIQKIVDWGWYLLIGAFLIWPALAILAIVIGLFLLLLAIVFVIGLSLLPFALVWYFTK